MNKRIPVGIAVTAIFIAITIAFAAAWIISQNVFAEMISGVQERAAMYDKISEIDSAVRQNYFGGVDDDAIQEGMAKGYLSAIPDSKTSYVTSHEIAAIKQQMTGKTVGIGVYTEKNASGYAVVTQVVSASPADKIGMLPGDIIISVNDEDALVLGYDAVAALMFGTEGESIKLDYTRDGEDGTADMIYSAFNRSTIVSYFVGNALYIRFKDLNDMTATEFHKTVDGNSAGAIVFDLRNLDGGYDKQAVDDLLDILMPKGFTYTGINGTGAAETLHQVEGEGILSSMKCAVLVNENTRGLAELLAGCLSLRKDIHLVGTPTAGIGTLQQLYVLGDGSGVYVSKYKLMPGGTLEFHETGLNPEFLIEPEEGFVFKEGMPNPQEDVQYRKALDVLQG